jgi:hypothetical protein
MRVMESWGSVRALWTRLRGVLPLDLFLWPGLKGQKSIGSGAERGVNAFRLQVRPVHHVIDSAALGGRLFLLAGGAHLARSFTAVGFAEPAEVLEARGKSALANLARLRQETIAAGAGQILRAIMAGADEAFVQRAIREVNETLDRTVMNELSAELNPIDYGILKIPCLYLEMTQPPWGTVEFFEIFRQYAPDARRDHISEWGIRMQEEAGGHELADKVIPFIQEVIAQRDNP